MIYYTYTIVHPRLRAKTADIQQSKWARGGNRGEWWKKGAKAYLILPIAAAKESRTNRVEVGGGEVLARLTPALPCPARTRSSAPGPAARVRLCSTLSPATSPVTLAHHPFTLLTAEHCTFTTSDYHNTPYTTQFPQYDHQIAAPSRLKMLRHSVWCAPVLWISDQAWAAHRDHRLPSVP